jgi:hypothetical protein
LGKNGRCVGLRATENMPLNKQRKNSFDFVRAVFSVENPWAMSVFLNDRYFHGKPDFSRKNRIFHGKTDFLRKNGFFTEKRIFRGKNGFITEKRLFRGKTYFL